LDRRNGDYGTGKKMELGLLPERTIRGGENYRQHEDNLIKTLLVKPEERKGRPYKKETKHLERRNRSVQ